MYCSPSAIAHNLRVHSFIDKDSIQILICSGVENFPHVYRFVRQAVTGESETLFNPINILTRARYRCYNHFKTSEILVLILDFRFFVESCKMASTVDYFPKPFDFDPDQSLFLTEEEEEECKVCVPIDAVKGNWSCRKYELLTPPRSPAREDDVDLVSVADTLLEIVSTTLDIDTNTPQSPVFPDCTSLKSKLIQDCMWNGFNGSDTIVEIKGLVAAEDYYDTPCSTPPPVEYNVNTDCVDPSAVFPYPVNDHHQASLGSISSQCCSDSGKRVLLLYVCTSYNKHKPTQ